jgi:hypothetical protein
MVYNVGRHATEPLQCRRRHTLLSRFDLTGKTKSYTFDAVIVYNPGINIKKSHFFYPVTTVFSSHASRSDLQPTADGAIIRADRIRQQINICP